MSNGASRETSDETSDPFLEARPVLFALAYRMLGSAAEAEDMVQEAWLRWSTASGVEAPRSWLTTVVARLCVDRLRSAQLRRESYVGVWLPEPVVADSKPGPADLAELTDSLSMALLVTLEELTPLERAAFLLREVFEFGYRDIAEALTSSEAACRQLVSRARRHVGQRRVRFAVDSAAARELTGRFLQACQLGDVDALVSMLAADATMWSDGGGKARAALRPVSGASNVARFLVGIAAKAPAGGQMLLAALNGQLGAVVVEGAQVTSSLTLDVVDGRVVGVRIVANPDKLHAVQAAFDAGRLE